MAAKVAKTLTSKDTYSYAVSHPIIDEIVTEVINWHAWRALGFPCEGGDLAARAVRDERTLREN